MTPPSDDSAVGAPRSGGRAWLLGGLALAVAFLVGGLVYSGSASSRQVLDPGAFVRWGLPVSKGAVNVSLSILVGALAFAVAVLPPRTSGAGRGSHRNGGAEHPAFTQALRIAAVAAIAWTVSSIAVLVLTHSDLVGQAVSGSSDYTRQLVYYMTELEVGRSWLAVVVIAAAVATLVFAVRSLAGLAVALVLTFCGLVPMALVGHSASAADHIGSVNSLGLHMAGAALWLGGVVVLALLSGTLCRGSVELLSVTLGRFSSMAFLAFVLVTSSGIINASLRLATWTDLLGSAYGHMIILKTFGTLVLGGIGFMHRQWILPRLRDGPGVRRVLWQLIGVEILIMGLVSGTAVALSRSAPPEPEESATGATPAFLLSGYELPPELTPSRWLSEWRPDWLWIAVAVALGVSYALGLVKLRRRGDSWPWARAVSWFVGLIVLTYITSGPPAVYGTVLFSAHMVDHMMLTMVAPIFLVLGSPVTLALRALSPRTDGSRGAREWILALVHSKFSIVVTHPLFAAANFAGSIILFYYSDLFGYAMREHIGHELMNVHFLLTGYIFVLGMIGSDPLPRRAQFPLRLLLLFATMAFHAFFGVAIMGSNILLEPGYFGNLGRAWGPSAIEDQQAGGAIAWGIGEVPTLFVAIGVAVMWSRSDARETKRKDRAADRNHDAELNAYNQMFAKLASRDQRIAEGEREETAAGSPAGDEHETKERP